MLSANGTQGYLIYAGENFMFRVYDADYNFVDYDILHCDLAITISDTDAYFYNKPRPHIDYSLNTLLGTT